MMDLELLPDEILYMIKKLAFTEKLMWKLTRSGLYWKMRTIDGTVHIVKRPPYCVETAKQFGFNPWVSSSGFGYLN